VACLASFVQVDSTNEKAPEVVTEQRLKDRSGIVLAQR
jgi:hypothetical protein